MIGPGHAHRYLWVVVAGLCGVGCGVSTEVADQDPRDQVAPEVAKIEPASGNSVAGQSAAKTEATGAKTGDTPEVVSPNADVADQRSGSERSDAAETEASQLESLASSVVDEGELIEGNLSDDPTDPVSSEPNELAPAFRLWVPTTAGPLLIDADIRIGDEPLQQVFQQRVAKVMDEAGDPSNLTWPQLFAHVASEPEQFGRASTINAQEHRNLIRLFDKNRNKRADHDEVARFVFRDTGFNGPFRLIGSDYYRQINRTRSAVFKTLDRDGNGMIETTEIDVAADSLYRLDHNGDLRVEMSEVVAMPRANDPAWKKQRSSRWGEVAMDLSGFVDWQMLSYTVGDSFDDQVRWRQPGVLTQIDQDGDASIDGKEAKSLVSVAADMRLRIDFPLGPADSPASLQVVDVSEQLARVVKITSTSDQVTIAGDELRLIARVSDRRTGRNPIPAEAFMALDADNDGGLSESEIPEQALRQYSFDELDADEDGKLTLLEINEGMSPKAPIWNVQIRGRGAEAPDGVFAWLDENQDHVLSTREISGIIERLRKIAESKGAIRATDIPDAYLIQFGRGDPNQDAQLFAASSVNPGPRASWDRWAQAMDTNRDEDISREEFTGSAEQFETLDRDGDGFISEAETR